MLHLSGKLELAVTMFASGGSLPAGFATPRCHAHVVTRTLCQASTTVSRPRQELTAVRTSLAGLPLHQASGQTGPDLLPVGRERQFALPSTHLHCKCTGGRLVAPVLLPQTDNIPFGLAISLQTQTADSQRPISAIEDDLYELQYVLEGNGEVRTNPDTIMLPGTSAKRVHIDHTSSALHTLLITLLHLQLQATSGNVQHIAAGDSILAPVGRAWCHLPVDEQAHLSHLAVLTLLVPGASPHEGDQRTLGEFLFSALCAPDL